MLVEHPVVERVAHKLGPGREQQLLADPRTMRLDRADGEEELVRDLGVRMAECDQPQDLDLALARDEVVCHVPRAHLWARLGRVTLKQFLRTPMVLRDPQSNARWTVDAVLHSRGLELAAPLVEAATPGAAWREALTRMAPTLLSRHVVPEDLFCEVVIDGGIRFPRDYELALPAVGEPVPAVKALVEEFSAAVVDW